MMASLFVTTAHKLLADQPHCRELMFDPLHPYGLVVDDMGVRRLNLGVAGVFILMTIAEEVTEREVDAVFHDSWDRQEFWRWAKGCRHTFNGTAPEWPEQQALKGMDERANADLYARFGLLQPRENRIDGRGSQA